MKLRQHVDTLITFPVRFSLWVSLYGLLIFLPLIRPPILLTLILVSGLVYLSMFFGRVLARSPTAEQRDSGPI